MTSARDPKDRPPRDGSGPRSRALPVLGGLLAIGAFVWWAVPRGQPADARGVVSASSSSEDREAESDDPEGSPAGRPAHDAPSRPAGRDSEQSVSDPAKGDPEAPEARPGGPEPLPPVQSRRERELPAEHKSMQAARIAAALQARKDRAEQRARLADERGDAEEAARQRVIAARLAARAARLQGDAESFRALAGTEDAPDTPAAPEDRRPRTAPDSPGSPGSSDAPETP